MCWSPFRSGQVVRCRLRLFPATMALRLIDGHCQFMFINHQLVCINTNHRDAYHLILQIPLSQMILKIEAEG